jgi:hypothetical protein
VRNFLAPVPLIAALLLLAAGPTHAGIIGPPPEPPEPPSAVLYSVEAGLLLLVPSDFELDDFEGDPFPSDLALVDFDDLTHGSSDAFAITQICVTDPSCRDKILGSGPGGRLPLVDALLDVYGDSDIFEPPDNGDPVPEPGTAALLGLGLGALALASRSRG